MVPDHFKSEQIGDLFLWRIEGLNSDQDFHLKTNISLLTEANALLKTDFCKFCFLPLNLKHAKFFLFM